MFLKELRGHENVVKLLDLIPAKNPNDLYLIFEFMENDLHNVIRGKILEEVHKKYVTYQLLKGLKFIHSGEIIHRGNFLPSPPDFWRISKIFLEAGLSFF